MGTVEAFEALSALDEEAKVPAATLLNEWLRCFEKLPREKQSQALTSFQETMKSPATQWKLGVLRAVVISPDKAKAAELLLDSLIGVDQQLQMTAAQLAASSDPDTARKIFNGFDSYPPTSQAAILAAYAERQIPGTKDKAVASITAEDPAVRRAALTALASVGDAATAVMLAKIAAERTGAEQTAARDSIARIRGNDVDAAMMQALGAGDAKVKAELIRGLAARRAMSALPTLEQLAKSDAASAVRVEAINALGVLAPPKSLPTILDILQSSKEQRETQAAESAAAAVLTRIDNAEERAAPLLTVLPKTTGETRMAMLRLLGRTGSRDALAALRTELASGPPAMRNATVRALSEWPDAAVTNDLLKIAKEDPANTNKVLAIRGYVRVVALPSDRRPSETARMLGEVLKIAPTNEKKAVLGALGAVSSPEALRLVVPLMEEQAVRNEAITASLRIARAVAGAVPDEATTAANRALEFAPQDETVKRNAQAALNAAERSRDFITEWLVAGPYMQEGKDKDAVFDIAFAPEKGEEPTWKKMPASPDRSRFWEMNLEAVSDLRGENRAAYLKTQIILPKAQELQLEVGSDDAIKVWINGQLVHSNNAARGNEPGQDKVKVKLNEGSNTILMKVINGGGGWGANARLRTLDDKKVTGMRVRAE
jgi:HEAT repeat protein